MNLKVLFAKRLSHVIASLALVFALLAMTACSNTGAAAQSSSDTASDQASVSDQTETIASIDESGMDFSYTDRELDASYDESSATKIVFSPSGPSVEGEGASADGSAVTIDTAGTYLVSGTTTSGSLLVSATDSDKMQIVLDGASITSADGPALNIIEADKVFVTLADGTTNTLSDSTVYTLAEGEDEPNATLYSKADLCINGSGELSVTGTYMHAINSKDDLVITGGTIDVNAVEDALRGKDCVKINGGTLALEAGGDGIKSNNDEDETRGFVSITGGSFDIHTGDDGIQAATLLRVMDGTISIDSADDALHSDIEGLIAGGSLSITAGDDAVHAETLLTVSGGTTDVSSCVEGFEAEDIEISGGTNHIVSSDDGLNAAAASTGTESESAAAGTDAGFGGKMGGAPGASSAACIISISGGTTVIDASADGVDSNGSVEVSGGVLLVCGPTSNNDGAFDYDGSASITGGTVLMVGSVGMAQNFSEGSQPFVYTTLDTTAAAGTGVAITDADGNVLASFTPAKAYQMVLASSPAMSEGQSVQIVLGGSVESADTNGFATTGNVSGGSAAATVSASTTPSGGSGAMGGMGGGLQGGGDMRGDPGANGGPQDDPGASGAYGGGRQRQNADAATPPGDAGV